MRTISGLPRGFSTCCLRFTNGVAIIHAKLASGWLAGLYREGVEPSGSRRKVSDSVLILLSWTFPDATKIGSLMLDFQFDRAVPAMGRAVMPSFRPAPRYLFLATLIHIKDASRQTVHQEASAQGKRPSWLNRRSS